MQGKIVLASSAKEQDWLPRKGTEYENRLQTTIGST